MALQKTLGNRISVGDELRHDKGDSLGFSHPDTSADMVIIPFLWSCLHLYPRAMIGKLTR
jgi:hypothetical protein